MVRIDYIFKNRAHILPEEEYIGKLKEKRRGGKKRKQDSREVQNL
jgi:hypothetical protein